jgi:1,4-dihydroxy-2-naphthoate octaprenyltransferase
VTPRWASGPWPSGWGTAPPAASLLPFLAGLGGRPLAALAFVALVLARRPVVDVLSGARGPQLIRVLGDTGRVQLVYGVLVAVGFYVGG